MCLYVHSDCERRWVTDEDVKHTHKHRHTRAYARTQYTHKHTYARIHTHAYTHTTTHTTTHTYSYTPTHTRIHICCCCLQLMKKADGMINIVVRKEDTSVRSQSTPDLSPSALPSCMISQDTVHVTGLSLVGRLCVVGLLLFLLCLFLIFLYYRYIYILFYIIWYTVLLCCKYRHLFYYITLH